MPQGQRECKKVDGGCGAFTKGPKSTNCEACNKAFPVKAKAATANASGVRRARQILTLPDGFNLPAGYAGKIKGVYNADPTNKKSPVPLIEPEGGFSAEALKGWASKVRAKVIASKDVWMTNKALQLLALGNFLRMENKPIRMGAFEDFADAIMDLPEATVETVEPKAKPEPKTERIARVYLEDGVIKDIMVPKGVKLEIVTDAGSTLYVHNPEDVDGSKAVEPAAS